jgi:hypothetical protein
MRFRQETAYLPIEREHEQKRSEDGNGIHKSLVNAVRLEVLPYFQMGPCDHKRENLSTCGEQPRASD